MPVTVGATGSGSVEGEDSGEGETVSAGVVTPGLGLPLVSGVSRPALIMGPSTVMMMYRAAAMKHRGTTMPMMRNRLKSQSPPPRLPEPRPPEEATRLPPRPLWLPPAREGVRRT